jgi:hypothetical protein
LSLHPLDPIKRDTSARADRATRLYDDSRAGKPLGCTRRVQRIIDEVPQRIEIQLRIARAR